MKNLNVDRILEAFVELSSLTRMKRTGWILAGVSEPESIADHCYETALFAYILSNYIDEEVDYKKLFVMSLFHETGEARLVDLPRRSKKYVKKYKKNAENEATVDIIGDIAPEILEHLEEFEECESLEARLVEAAEELQIIFKALIYAKENNGDISEYRQDVEKYDSLGIEAAQSVADEIKKKLLKYLGKKEYWSIGYSENN
jgi:putative hydrolase of HD superfamily